MAIAKVMSRDIEKDYDLKNLLYEIEFPLVITLDKIERNGMHVSSEILNSLHAEYQERLDKLRDSIYEETGEEFNISSPKQLADVLFGEDKLNLPHGKKGKTGVYSTDSDELNRLRKYSPVIDSIIDYRVYWSPSRYFTGYQIQCATDEGFTKNVQTVKITDYSTYSTVFGSLTNGTRYYFRVRSYREFEGMTYFGGWSNVLSVKAGSGETVTPAVTTYRALCIGQNYTGSSNALAGCINDMKAIAGMLGGLGNSFTATTLEDASKTQILNGITSAYAGAKDTDVSIFTYSGHGVNAGGSGTNQGALCTFESNGSIKYITLSELASALSNVPGRVIVILDSCHSGSAVKGSGSEMDLDAFNQAVIEAFSGYYLETGNAQEGEKLGELKQSKFVVITAASYDESSWDGHFDGSGYSQGAFSAALVKALGSTYPNGAYSGGSMPADKDKDNKITLKELYDYVYTTAYNWAGQHAQYYGDDAEVLFFR